MQVHKIEILVIDFENLGPVQVQEAIANCSVGGHFPKVLDIQSRDIGKWSDDHPLNHRDSSAGEAKRLFIKSDPTSWSDSD